MIDINDIKNPDFIKDLNYEQLTDLAQSLRSFIISVIAKNGGHLYANNTNIELVLALFKIFDIKHDKLIFDGGYQSYTYNILNGKINEFFKLRKEDGLSGYFDEVIYDTYGLSIAYGEAVSRDLKGNDDNIICIVDSDNIFSAASLEALNIIGQSRKKVIIILNDYDSNNKSYNRLLTSTFNHLRENKDYLNLKKTLKDNLNKTEAGKTVYNKFGIIKNNIRDQVINGGIFSRLNINYNGPIDGHDISAIVKAINKAQMEEGPCLIHLETSKLKDLSLNIKNDHNLAAPFNIENGKPLISIPKGYMSYEEVIALSLDDLMSRYEEIVCILTYNDNSNAFKLIQAKFPTRVFKANNSLSIAFGLAYGLSKKGYHPFVLADARYIDEAISYLRNIILKYQIPCVIGLKNASLLQDEGDNYQGIYDISLLSSLDEINITEGRDYKDIRNLFYSGFTINEPYFIRINNTNVSINDDNVKLVEKGTWSYLRKLNDYKATIISYGQSVDVLLKELLINDLPYQLVNAHYINPIDTNIIDELVKEDKLIIIYNLDYKNNGLYDSIKKYINYDKIINMAIDKPVSIGSISQIIKKQELNWYNINEVIKKYDK